MQLTTMFSILLDYRYQINKAADSIIFYLVSQNIVNSVISFHKCFNFHSSLQATESGGTVFALSKFESSDPLENKKSATIFGIQVAHRAEPAPCQVSNLSHFPNLPLTYQVNNWL
jgi:hypothetical protein